MWPIVVNADDHTDTSAMETFLQLDISDNRGSNSFTNILALQIVQSDLTSEHQAATLGTHKLAMATNYTDSSGNYQIRASSASFTITVQCDDQSSSYPYTDTGLPCPDTGHDFCAENYKTDGPGGATC